ncbi:hypothetical protein Pmani_034893 [Petrolisthes manimaculis]|uniref:Enoyl-CoA delta isomerase 2, mitochondrial n=1 Tax=Petrolisthes manimaculis TaxID=1843537 RepID=A0AAE1NMS7_9EUCA|nr:hypothetical protein Pmani_034893 [Petrolisthes manimaculis]
MDKESAEVVVTVEGKVCVLRLNRPKMKNALSLQVYNKFMETLDKVGNDPNISIMVVTGTGDYFSSGNEFSMKGFEKLSENENESSDSGSETSFDDQVAKGNNEFKRFIDKLIDFPKPLIAVVNGPAVGVAVTMLPHFDVVFASDKATFHTPFVTLALVPEGCSSYLFPMIMGPGMAAQMLMFGKKITATEAYQHNFITEVVPNEKLDDVWTKISNWANLPPNTLVVIKNIIRLHQKETLHEINAKECEVLGGRFKDPEFFEAIMKFFTRKSKL